MASNRTYTSWSGIQDKRSLRSLRSFYFKKVFNHCLLFGICLLSALGAAGQVQLWGVSDNGGDDEIGTVFNLSSEGNNYTLSNSFNNRPDGAKPSAGITEGHDGLLYGVSASGGSNGAGTIFSYHEVLGLVKILDLDQTAHGTGSRSAMVEVSPNTFLGLNSEGGANGGGTLFRFNPDNGIDVVHHFDGAATGSSPRGAIAFDANSGTIFGACSNGASDGFGCIWSYNESDGIEVLHHFGGAESGSFPLGGLCLASDGFLYGPTQFGGDQSQGLVFRISTEGIDYEVIYAFQSQTADGRYPVGALIEGSTGLFLGTCSEGGSSGAGTIFSITSTGTFARLRSLVTGSNGSFPKAGLVALDNDTYLGVCEFGGNNGFGTLYSITSSGVFTKLHDFNYTEDGSNPAAELLLATDGSIYGHATNGGVSDAGSLIRFNPGGSFQKLHDFALPENGAHPVSILSAEDGFLGLSRAGGDFNAGTFFSVSLDGERTKLYEFESAFEGRHPNSDLVLHNDGWYYGTARFGGLNNAGTIFRLSPEGEYTLLHTFGASADGQFPFGGLALGSDGNFYGTTVAGGAFGNGVLYRVTPDGSYTKLRDFFSFFDGSSPQGSLVATPEATFLGTATGGGTNSAGTLFEFDPNGNVLTVLHHFDSQSGTTPQHKLLAHSNGSYYGSCSFGGNGGGGTLWKYSASGGLELIQSLTPNSHGAEPSGPMVQDEQGRVYGYCFSGGQHGNGTVYEIDNDSFTKIYDFNSVESPNPQGAPVLFFPECFDDEACPAMDECHVGICAFGACVQAPLLASMETISIGNCQPESDSFELLVNIMLGANPGGNLLIGGNSFDLDSLGMNFDATISGLPSNGQSIALEYTFEATGCSGVLQNLGMAPTPCPPATIHITLDVGSFQPGAQGIFVSGSWQNWTPASNPLTQIDDNIWEITLGVPEGTFEFNFFDGPNLFNAEYVVGACANNGKRTFTIEAVNDPVSFCWSSCAENCSLGLTHLPSDAVKLWPNPVISGGNVHVEVVNAEGLFQFQIVDALGRTIDSGQMNPHGPSTISTEGLNSGIYTVLLSSTAATTVHGVIRFMVQ